MGTDIHGYCDPRFSRVRQAFAAHFEPAGQGGRGNAGGGQAGGGQAGGGQAGGGQAGGGQAGGGEAGGAVCVFLGDELVADLWAGAADPRSSRQWRRDTPCLTFSCAKAVTAVCALHLLAAQAADADGPVSAWWPEFAAAGKERATAAHLLSHQAGLPAFSYPVTVEESADPAQLAARLAAQAPEWEPGTAHGYHALTFGWLAGEIVRRLSGQTVGQYLAEHIAGPRDLELWLGGPDEVIARAARITRRSTRPAGGQSPSPAGSQGPAAAGSQSPVSSPAAAASLAGRAFAYPDATSVPGGSNSPQVLRAGWPASGLLATATGLAAFYRDLLAGRLLDPAVLRSALVPRATGPDRVLGMNSAFGLGFMLPSDTFWVPPAGQGSAFGHSGLSGAAGMGDTASRLAVGYVTNGIGAEVIAATRAARLISAAYRSTA